MAKVERHLGGIIRIETSTTAEQNEAANDLEQAIGDLAPQYPIIRLLSFAPFCVRQERRRKIFVFGRQIHSSCTVDVELRSDSG